MIKKLGKGTILTLVQNISNAIYAISFLYRIVLNLCLVLDQKPIVLLQCNSCLYLNAGYAMLVFSTHFFGELLPLTAIFTLQLVTISKAGRA